VSLAEVVGNAEPALAGHAAADAGPALFEGPPAYVLEAVHEGYLLHWATSRAFEGMDDDLRLLAGDALYAQGLARLAEQGDLEAVGALADLITACSRAQAEGREADVDALWERSARRLAGRMLGR
jgi:hypothetical protein